VMMTLREEFKVQGLKLYGVNYNYSAR
jgi:hypothetical protein